MCYTSGTIGDPKCVVYNRRSNVLHATAAVVHDAMRISVCDVVLQVVPTFHACLGACSKYADGRREVRHHRW